MPSRRSVAAYWVWLTALAIVFMTVRQSQVSVIILAGLTTSAAIVHGVRRHRPVRRWPWYCLAAAVLAGAASQVASRLLSRPVGAYGPGSPVVYAALFVMSVLMIVGITGLARSAPRDLSAVVDVTILVLGTGLLAGVLVAVPYALTPDLPGIQSAARIFFVTRDVVLLAATVHFATSERWNGSLALLVYGVVALVTYDVTYRLGIINGIMFEGTPVELITLSFAGAWGMAALLPTMKHVGERDAPAQRSLPLRLSLLTVGSALPIALLMMATYSRTRQWYEPLVAWVSVLMLALVLTQLLIVAIRLRNQVAGERSLRQAVAELAAAGTRDDVVAMLEKSVPPLSTGRASRRVRAVVDRRPAEHELASLASDRPARAVVGQPPAAVRQRLGEGPATALPLRSADPRDGAILYVRGGRSALNDLWPRLDVLVAQADSVLERIRLGAELVRRTTEEYINAVAETSGDVILLVDDADLITLASRSAGSIFDESRLVGARLPELVDEAARGPVVELLDRARRRPPPPERHPYAVGDAVPPPANVNVEPAEAVETTSWHLHHGDGTEAEIELAFRKVTSHEPSVRGVLVDLRDVSEQRRLERELTERASHDPLTGLVSGSHIRARIAQSLKARPDELIGMIVLDINDFKLVNSRHGQDFGDQVLRAVADRLAAQLPRDGLAGRVSGDTFAVVAVMSTPADADAMATQLLATVARPIEVGGEVVSCTASAGVATTADASTAQELARQADLALLIAKDEGRGCWHHYDSTARSTVLDRLEIRAALDHALEEHALALEYQPIVDLETGVVAGFEALVRWLHPVFRQLNPETFMEVAEESDLVVHIGDWALATAIQDARRWDTADPETAPFVAVNVTSTQLASPGFYDSVRGELASNGLSPSRLHIEITESTLLRDDTVWSDLQQLRGTGIQVAIDDFGTGYSALSYLGRVPVDRIKLDRQFIASMTTSSTQRDLVEGIVRLAGILKLDVIAEGIETSHQRDLAAQVGCRFGQGYLFARPMPANAATAWLANERDRTRALATSGRERRGTNSL